MKAVTYGLFVAALLADQLSKPFQRRLAGKNSISRPKITYAYNFVFSQAQYNVPLAMLYLLVSYFLASAISGGYQVGGHPFFNVQGELFLFKLFSFMK